MMKYQNSKNMKASAQSIQVLQQMLEERVDDVFADLGVSLCKTSKMFFGSCPVHSGNNITALSVYYNHDGSGVFNWRCYTRSCERHFKKTILGLIRGILSQQEYNWQKPGDKEVPFWEALQWCEDFLQVKLNDVKIDQISTEKQQFINKWLNKAKLQTGKSFLSKGRKLGVA